MPEPPSLPYVPTGVAGPADPGGAPSPMVTARTAPGRRRWPSRRQVLAAVAAVVALALAATTLGLVYVTVRLGEVRRITVDGLAPVGPDRSQNILLTGSDTRVGQNAVAFGSATAVTGQRSDVIIVIHLDPGRGQASMLSIPRDLVVPIAGSSGSNRINSAFDASPSVLVRTITQSLGITINHYAQEDFGGLEGITDAVGGVCLDFAYPVRDGAPSGTGNESGLNIPTSGRHVLDGAAALALVRSRYYQYQERGRWIAEGTGDIGRIERQHTVMRALATRAIHRSRSNPLTANTVLGKAVGHITVDSTFTSLGMLRLALNLRSLHPGSIPSWTLPTRAVTNYRGLGDVLLPDPGADAAAIAAWSSAGAPARATSAPTSSAPPVGSVTVAVENGSGVAGQAAQVAAALRAAGYRVSTAGTATTPHAAGTTVAHGPVGLAAARALAARLRGPVSLTGRPDLTGASLVLTTGAGFAGLAPTSTAPPTTAAPATAAPSTGAPAWDPTPCT